MHQICMPWACQKNLPCFVGGTPSACDLKTQVMRVCKAIQATRTLDCQKAYLYPSSEDALLLTTGPNQAEAASRVQDVEGMKPALLQALALYHHSLQEHEVIYFLSGSVG